jgi:hypothetical protein
VTDNGREIAYGNIGGGVAVELGTGAHVVEVSYVGSRWANWASGMTLAFLIVGGVTRFPRAWRNLALRNRRKTSAPPLSCALIALGSVSVGGSTAWAIRAAVERAATDKPRVVTASRQLSNAPVANAFDGRDDTAWAVNGPEPASVTIRDGRATMIRGVRLHARRTGLFEAWQVVRVVASTHGWPSLDHTFELKNAARDGIIDLTFAEPVSADRIQLEFVYPVLETPAGQRLRPDQVNPGYTEIEILTADRG